MRPRCESCNAVGSKQRRAHTIFASHHHLQSLALAPLAPEIEPGRREKHCCGSFLSQATHRGRCARCGAGHGLQMMCKCRSWLGVIVPRRIPSYPYRHGMIGQHGRHCFGRMHLETVMLAMACLVTSTSHTHPAPCGKILHFVSTQTYYK